MMAAIPEEKTIKNLPDTPDPNRRGGKDKDLGFRERVKRNAAIKSMGNEGLGTTFGRGLTAIGSIAQEFLNPSQSMPTKSEIQRVDKGVKAQNKAKKKKKGEEAMNRSEGARRKFEEGTGTDKIRDPLEAVKALTEAAVAEKKKKGD
jgi:hypothetical protein